MTSTFRGERPEYDEHAAGTIRLEIDLELWSNSGRDKHVDLTEQGGWLIEVITRALKEQEAQGKTPEWLEASDTAIHEIRYFGEQSASTKGVVFTRSVSGEA